MKAGGKAKGLESIDAAAYRLFSDVQVKAYYDSLIEAATNSAIMTREQALERLTKSAQVTITDVCEFRNVKVGEDDSGQPIYQTVWTIKDSENIPPHIAACIKSVTITKTGPKIELYDSNAAIKQLSTMEGWDAPKRSELTGKDGKPLALKTDVKAPEVVAALGSLMDKL